MKIKNSSKYFWQILCLIAVAGCEDDVARYRDIFQCPEGQIFDSTGTCGNANELCGSLFCLNGKICIDGQCQDEHSCSNMNCPPDKTCINATCIDNACLDENNVEIDCGSGKTCSNGKCIEDACLNKNNVEIDCGYGKTCSNGKCIDEECIVDGYPLICNPGFECIKGECIESPCTGTNCPCDGDDCPHTDNFIILTTPAVTDESGTTDTFKISLSSEPTADVSITITISNPDEVTTETSHFTIPKSEWDKPISVILVGVADHIIDGDQDYEVMITSESDDPNYNQKEFVIHGTNRDTDKAEFNYVYKPSPEVHESTESKVTIEISLTSKPSSSVEITAIPASDTEITIENPIITISPDDWNIPHIITVAGVPDNIVDGNQTTQIQLIAQSEDENFNGYTDHTLTITTIDDDTAELIVTSESMILSENGGTGSFTIKLSSKPHAAITINLSSTDPTELEIVGSTTITILPEDWNTPVTVNFKTVEDDLTDGTQLAQINIATTSDDTNYNNLTTSTPIFSITDDEQPSIVLATDSNELKPHSNSSTVMVQLSAKPTDDVTVTLATGNDDLLHPNITTLVFTPENWNVGQSVTVNTSDLSSVANSVTTVQLSGTGSSNCNAYNGINSNTLDYLIYSYDSEEYSYPVNGDDEPVPECIVVSYDLLPGRYKLQVWGASGGDEVGLDQTSGSHAGLGGYAEGILSLDARTRIYIHVGSRGKAGTGAYGENAVGGGCNGGGAGTASSMITPLGPALGFGGGGASDIRIGEDTYYHRVIVAGGGGGADDGIPRDGSNAAGPLGGTNDGSGGAGGGEEGEYGKMNGVVNINKANAIPGTQSSGYLFGEGQPAGLKPNTTNQTSDFGGGGGGWYGGKCSRDHNEGGAGGSGYVFTSTSYIVEGYELDEKYQLTDAILIPGSQSFPSPSDDSSDEIGHKGDGFVKITLITD